MNCKSARDLFSSRLDGRLSYAEESRLTQHLERCSRCAPELAKLDRNLHWVRELPEIAPSESFLQGVLLSVRRCRTEGQPPPEPGWIDRIERLRSSLSPGWLSPPRFAAAALVLGLAIGIGGGMLAVRAPAPVSTAEEVPSQVGPPDAAPSAKLAEAPPAGQFEDLVDEMVRRLDAGDESETDEPAPADLDWGSAYGQDALGRQVGAASQDRRPRDPSSRVTIVF